MGANPTPATRLRAQIAKAEALAAKQMESPWVQRSVYDVPQLAAALRACLGALEQIERADDLDTAIGTAYTALVRAVAAMGDGDGMA